MYDINPNRSVGEILTDIQRGSVGTASNQNMNLVGSILSPFAALLVMLSSDAEAVAASVNQKTQTLIALTKWLIVLTVILIILTVPIVANETRRFVTEAFQTPLHLKQDK